MMQTRPDQQSNDQHQSNKCADAVPAIVMPENTTQRPGNTRPQIVTEQIQRGGLAFSCLLYTSDAADE